MAERAIVTGGAGFIGSHVVDALLADGDAVTVVDDLSSGERGRVADGAELQRARHRRPRARCERGRRGGAPAGDLSTWPPRRAWWPPSRTPLRDCDVNVKGTLNVLEAAREHAARRSCSPPPAAPCTGTRRPEPTRRGADPRAAVSVRSLEVGGRGVREDVVAVVRDPERDDAARQRVRAAPEPARGGGGGGDLHPPPVHRTGPRSSTATARRPATTCTWPTSSTRCSRPRGRAGTFNIATGVETDVATIWRELCEAAGKQIEPELADLRPGELAAQLPGRRPAPSASSGGGRGRSIERGPARSPTGALIEEFEAGESSRAACRPRPHPVGMPARAAADDRGMRRRRAVLPAVLGSHPRARRCRQGRRASRATAARSRPPPARRARAAPRPRRQGRRRRRSGSLRTRPRAAASTACSSTARCGRSSPA